MDNTGCDIQPSSDEMAELEELTKDYASYLQVDSEKEIKDFYESIEWMLTKLDDFGQVLDTVRSETKECVDTKVPDIEAKCKEMELMFHRIDQLEKFVSIVRNTVNATEEQVNKAEHEMGTFSGFRKMFSSFVGSKKPAQAPAMKVKYEPPDIFSTGDYLTTKQPEEVIKESKEDMKVETTTDTTAQETDGHTGATS